MGTPEELKKLGHRILLINLIILLIYQLAILVYVQFEPERDRGLIILILSCFALLAHCALLIIIALLISIFSRQEKFRKRKIVSST